MLPFLSKITANIDKPSVSHKKFIKKYRTIIKKYRKVLEVSFNFKDFIIYFL